jgi:hypothetical protein
MIRVSLFSAETQNVKINQIGQLGEKYDGQKNKMIG